MRKENQKILTLHKIIVQIMIIATTILLKQNLSSLESKKGKALHLQIKQSHMIMS